MTRSRRERLERLGVWLGDGPVERIGRTVLVFTGVCLVATTPTLAQTTGEAFCQTSIVDTIRNLFTVIQFGGPLLGGVIALGATVSMPMVRRSDKKLELKEIRNQGVVWGVLVAPLGTVILQFLLSNVVAGGASCGF